MPCARVECYGWDPLMAETLRFNVFFLMGVACCACAWNSVFLQGNHWLKHLHRGN